jgi:asparagine synthase (glutamine-hydrolysing)
MCGIAGFVSFKTDTPTNPDTVLRAMTDSIRHRGPDGEGFWSQGNIYLGHRRLCVIDLETGDQPMASDDGNVIVFNGEIYNYREIRKTLKAKGRTFNTQSDTEVLLQAFEEWGEDCLGRLNGMFAFAIWDHRKRTLFIARDRLGKKPFYYFAGQDFFAFASELKGLMAIPEMKANAEIDVQALSDYLSLGYILSPKSIFKQIKKLPPATSGWLCGRTGSLSMKRYWILEDFYRAQKLPNNQATIDAFRDLLFDAVNIRLHADVPLAGFLSGGIDSAAVLAAMVKAAPANTRAMCMGFDQDDFDESQRAQDTADHLGIPLDILNHKSIGEGDLERLIWHTDEPFADTSILPTFELCRAAKENVTVALSGDGADEILAGYPTYQADRLFSFYQYFPNPVQHLLHRLGCWLLKPSYKKVSLDYKMRQFLGSAGMSSRQAHYWWRNIFSEDEKKCLMSEALHNELQDYSPFQVFDDFHDKVADAGFLDQCLFVDTMTWLPDDILTKVDRMSMANGLEVRSPFLDHRLVEYAARLPENMKYNLRTQKAILRQAMRPHLSQQTLNGPKRGFNAPINHAKGLALQDVGTESLFNAGFVLNPEKEDVTYKSFLLNGLDTWIRMKRLFQSTDKWTSSDKAKNN